MHYEIFGLLGSLVCFLFEIVRGVYGYYVFKNHLMMDLGYMTVFCSNYFMFFIYFLHAISIYFS